MIDTEKINELVEETRAYLEAKIDLIRVNFIAQSTENLAAVLAAFIIGGFLLIFLIFLSLFVAIALSTLWSSEVLGYAAVAGFYLLLVVVLIIFRKSILEIPIQNKTIKKIFKDAKK